MRLVFISEQPYFDTSQSIAKYLFRRFDKMSFVIDNRVDAPCHFPPIKMKCDVEKANKFKELSFLNSLIKLDSTYLLRSYSYHKKARAFQRCWKCFTTVFSLHPDIIVTDTISLQSILTILVYHKRTVLLVHDPFIHSGEAMLHVKILRKLAFRLIKKKILFNSMQLNDFVNSNNLLKSDVTSTFLSVNERYCEYCLNPIKKDSIKILFFGRISPYKGLEYLLEALFQLKIQKGINYEIIVAGGGAFYFDIAKYNNLNMTIINKYIDDYSLAQMISDCSFVVCPYTDATQSGVVMSAYALCKPVIATEVGALPEMIINGKTGILVPPKDVKSLANAIETLGNNGNILSDYEENIRNIYHNGERSWDKSVTNISNVIYTLYNEIY